LGICEGRGHWVLKENRKRRVLEGILTYYGRGEGNNIISKGEGV
jgi:hypothetical protein